jgi:hypothetical protein
MNKRTSIYRTEKYPATALFQNHLDFIHDLLESYCIENKDYSWGVTLNFKNYSADDGAVLEYISESRPDNLQYFVMGAKSKSELVLAINDGVTINIKSGTYELYGLFAQLKDACASMSSPHLIVFFRKYWLFSLLAAGMIIPILIILLAGGGWWFLSWIVIGGLIETGVIVSLLETSDWDDYILSTRIHYDKYDTKTLGVWASIFGSVKGIISVLASLATVVTFVIFLVAR